MAKRLPVTVTTHEPDADPWGKLIDWSNESDRRWLMSHMSWAMHHQTEVVVCPAANQYDAVLSR